MGTSRPALTFALCQDMLPAGTLPRLASRAARVRLMVRELEMLEQFGGDLHKLVNVQPNARRGTAPLRTQPTW